MEKNVRDPVSGYTHLAGALLGVFGLVYLLRLTLPGKDPRSIASAIIFGVSLVLLYASSAAYHLVSVLPETRLIYRRIDHALIFTLIAGSYTPFCLVTLRNDGGTRLMWIVWSIALVGLALSLFWIHAPRWLSTALYLFMGWFVVFDMPTLMRLLDHDTLTWLYGGGMSYTLGAFIYAFQRPDPFPPHFGFHEIWHLMVLAGSTCHFVSVAYILG